MTLGVLMDALVDNLDLSAEQIWDDILGDSSTSTVLVVTLTEISVTGAVVEEGILYVTTSV